MDVPRVFVVVCLSLFLLGSSWGQDKVDSLNEDKKESRINDEKDDSRIWNDQERRTNNDNVPDQEITEPIIKETSSKLEEGYPETGPVEVNSNGNNNQDDRSSNKGDPKTSPVEVNSNGEENEQIQTDSLEMERSPGGSEGAPIHSNGPEGTPVVSNGPEGTPVVSNGPEGTPVVSNGPEGTPVVSNGPEGTPDVSNGPDKTTTGGNGEVEESIIPGLDQYKVGAELVTSLYFEDKAKGYEILKEAALVGNQDAKELLAYGYLYGNVLQRNFTKSLEIFTGLAGQGHASGQQGLGLLHSTGIVVNSSQAKAVLYYTFGALGGHHYSQMAMGYRSLLGVGVPQSCEISLSYYAKVAATVANAASVFAGGHAVQKARLTDDDDEPTTVFAGVTEDELEHYREVFADTGAEFSLGLYYLFGLGGVERNLPQAMDLLKRADTPAAMALIGRIYAEGSPPDIQQDNETAISYFKQAIDQKNPEGYAGLGIMYFKGMGVEKDYRRALELFQRASDRGSQEANLYIGLANLFGLGIPVNPTRALSSLKSAAQSGHILALFYMGEIYANGLTGRRNCKQAVELYKVVAERGKWSRLLREAHKTYLSGDTESALLMYLHLGELGIEVAQSNAAYILHEDNTDLLVRNESLKRALMLWSRSATQGYSVARVMLGDYYYYGYGTEQDMELAVDQYRLASDKLSNPQAMFNLGYMYENGIGLQQDYHLAKRYYDLSAGTNADAALPVYLALLKLSVVSYWQMSTEQLSSHEKLKNVTETLWYLLDQWDIYLIAILCVVLAIAVRWHRR